MHPANREMSINFTNINNVPLIITSLLWARNIAHLSIDCVVFATHHSSRYKFQLNEKEIDKAHQATPLACSRQQRAGSDIGNLNPLSKTNSPGTDIQLHKLFMTSSRSEGSEPLGFLIKLISSKVILNDGMMHPSGCLSRYFPIRQR